MIGRETKRTVQGLAFIAPAAAVVLLFSFGSMAVSFWVSLHQWHRR